MTMLQFWPLACHHCNGEVYPWYKKGRVLDNGKISPGNPKCLGCSRYGPGILHPAWAIIWQQAISEVSNNVK